MAVSDVTSSTGGTLRSKQKSNERQVCCIVMSSEVETSLALCLWMSRDLIRSLPVRSASGLPVYLAAFPGCSVLHFGRNDRMSGTRWRLCIAKRLQGCDADCSTYNLVRPATWIRKASNSSALFLSSSWARACPIQSIPLLIDHRTRSGQPFRCQSKESLG